MIRKYLTLLPAIALLLYVKQACAIGITLDSGSFAFTTASIGSFAQLDVENDIELLPVPHSFSLSARGQSSLGGPAATSNGTWNFVNDPTQAVFTGSHAFLNEGSAISSSSAVTSTTINFTLSETASYSFTGSLLANNNAGSTAEILGRLVDLSPSGGLIYLDTKTGGTTSVLLELFPNGSTGTNTGTLTAGIYQFIFNDEIRNGLGGSGTGEFNFTLTAADGGNGGNGGAHVPDAGSTLLLLGSALGGLHFLRLRFVRA